MSDDTKRDDELGALWVKEGPRGEFMTGSVICTQCKHKEDIILFTNQFKSKPNHPSWRILQSRQQGERHTHVPSTRRDEQTLAGRQADAKAKAWQQADRAEEFDSRDIPQQRYQPGAGRSMVGSGSKKPFNGAKNADWTADVPHPVTDDDIPF